MSKLIIIVLVILLAGAGLAFWLGELNKPDQNDIDNNLTSVTLAGNTVCLPHQDTSGPITLECAIGLETAEGNFYALDTSRLSDSFIDSNDPVTVSGQMISRSALPENDPRLKYAIAGVITVESFTTGFENDSTETHTIPGGEVSFDRPDNFALAVTQEQVLVQSTIPPCAEGFDYCLYYDPEIYAGTNFSTAGLRIEKRNDLSGDDCLVTPPNGYDALVPTINRQVDYATSQFSGLQDAGAGHYSEGSLYRLETNGSCYEFESRIGQSQYENYPTGTIDRFTEADKQNVEMEIKQLLSSVRLAGSGSTIIFNQ